MKKLLISLFAAILALSTFANDFDNADEALGDNYVVAFGTMRLPQGSGRVARRAGGEVRIGRYLTDTLSVEAGSSWLEDEVGFSAAALWHLQGWEAWGKLFGYERFDPFLTLGARGWTGGEVGPAFGVGAYYHLDENWSLRFDADATVGLDTSVETDYTLSVGMRYSF